MTQIEVRKVSKYETIMRIGQTEICIVIGRAVKCRQYVTNVRLGKRIDIRLLRQGSETIRNVDTCVTVLETLLRHVLQSTHNTLTVRKYRLIRLVREVLRLDASLDKLLHNLKHVKCVKKVDNKHRCKYICKLVEEDSNMMIHRLLRQYSKNHDVTTKIRHLTRFAALCNIPLTLIVKALRHIVNIIHSVKLFYIHDDIIITGLQYVPFRCELPSVKAWYSTGTYCSVAYNGDDFYTLQGGYVRKVRQYSKWLYYMSKLYPTAKKCIQYVEYLSGTLRKKCFEKYVGFMSQ